LRFLTKALFFTFEMTSGAYLLAYLSSASAHLAIGKNDDAEVVPQSSVVPNLDSEFTSDAEVPAPESPTTDLKVASPFKKEPVDSNDEKVTQIAALTRENEELRQQIEELYQQLEQGKVKHLGTHGKTVIHYFVEGSAHPWCVLGTQKTSSEVSGYLQESCTQRCKQTKKKTQLRLQ
jgi:hypothetical protein